MINRLMARGLVTVALCAGGCTEVLEADPPGRPTGGAGGASMSGASGATGAGGDSAGSGASICPTGAEPTSFGATSGATIGVVADASGVYWTNDEGSVWAAGPGGVSPHPLAAGLGAELDTLAVSGASVFVVDYGHALWRVDKASGQTALLAQGVIVAVAADAGGVYFTSVNGVHRADPGGGSTTLLAPLEGASSLALDEAWVYVKTIADGADSTARIHRVPRAGGMAELVATSPEEAYHYGLQELAVDASHVYWVAPAPGAVMRVDKAGGPSEAVVTGLADPVALAIDGPNLYFTVRGKDGGSLADRAVGRVPAAGGAVTFVAHGPAVSAFGVALDATRAYWTEKVVTGPVNAACK